MQQVSGPTAWIKLSNGEKNIYLFGEFHMNYLECKHPFDPFHKYLQNQFENTKSPIDFFLETYKEGFLSYPNVISSPNNTMNHIRKYFSYVNESGIYNHKNHRMHYFDFREQLSLDKVLDYYQNQIHLLNFDNDIIQQNIQYLTDSIKLITNFIEVLKDPKKESFIYKILHKYSNPDLKNKIMNLVKFLNQTCITLVFKINNFIEKYITFINQFLDNHLNKNTLRYFKSTTQLVKELFNYSLEKDYDDIHNTINFVCCSIIDIYVIRRLLDKQYINNTIYYGGFYHMNHIVYVLLKWFNFEVVNQDSHINPSELKTHVNQLSYDDFIQKDGIVELYPPIMTQCVNCPTKLFD